MAKENRVSGHQFTGYTNNAGKENISFVPSSNHHLIEFHSLPELHKELFLSRYGVAHKDVSVDGKILSETDNLVTPLSSGFQPQSHHLLKHQNNLRKSGQQLCETVLSKIVSLSKNENTQDLLQYLEKMYSDHSLIHQRMGTRTLSKNQFFSRLQQILKLDERSRDIFLPQICFGRQ